MNSFILRTATEFLRPLLLLFSVFLLLRGHHEPGGGFVGGLIAASAYVLHAIAYDARSARRVLRVEPHQLMGAGLLLAVGSGSLSFFKEAPFMTGFWWKFEAPFLGRLEIGTPLIFDAGVYVVVLGFTLMIFLNLIEE